MKINQKIKVLGVVIGVLLFAGTSLFPENQKNIWSVSNSLIELQAAEVEEETSAEESVSVLLPTSHQKVGEILQTVADSQNVNLEIRLAGNEPRYTEELVSALESEDRPDIYWIEGEASAQVLDESEYYIYDLSAPASGLLLESTASLVPIDFRLLNAEKTYALPLGSYAQGTLVNLPVLAALLGTSDLIALQRDLILCDYEEWQVMQTAIADYLVTPGRYQFTLADNLYTMPSYRPSEAENLRGLWALATVGDSTYAKNSLMTTFSSVYVDPENYLEADPELRNALMEEALQALFAEMEFETQHMVGHDGALSRGEGFSLAREVTAEEAREFFENGTALLWKSDTQQAMQIESENPSLSGNLFLVPTKLPFENEEVAGVNQLYSLDMEGYLAVVNAKEANDVAGQLLVQLFTEESSLQALQTELGLLPYTEFYPQSQILRSLEESVGIGEYYLMPIEPSLLLTTEQRIGDWVNLNLMDLSEWSEEDEAAFITAVQGMWGELDVMTTQEAEEETEDVQAE